MSLATLQIVAPIAIVSSGVVFMILERYFPYNRGQKAFREGFWVDLIFYGIVQSYLMGLLISQLIYYVDQHAGSISRLHLVTGWPIWVQVVFFIVTHDLSTYLIHRLQHRSDLLWRTHEAHHSTRDVDFLSGIRSHSAEILMYQTAEFLPVVLLGAAPEVPLWKGMANAIYGMYIHSNLATRHGILMYVFNGPELHRWHHANDRAEGYGMNLGTKFTIWDVLFRTLWIPPPERAQDYGTTDPAYPKGWFSQHWYAFRRAAN